MLMQYKYNIFLQNQEYLSLHERMLNERYMKAFAIDWNATWITKKKWNKKCFPWYWKFALYGNPALVQVSSINLMSVSRSFDTKYVMKTFLRFPRILPAFSTNHGKFQLSWCISTSSGMVGTNFDSMKECLSELHKRHDTVDIALPNLIYSLYITIWKRVLCQVTVTKLHSVQSVKQLWQSRLQPYIQVKFLFKKSMCSLKVVLLSTFTSPNISEEPVNFYL